MDETPAIENPQSALRAWRATQDLTQRAAGELVTVSGPTWHDWETGGRVPSAGYREALERLTGIPASAWRSPAEVAAVERAERAREELDARVEPASPAEVA